MGRGTTGGGVNDPTLERIWAARDAIAKRAGYDAKTLVAQLREREKKSKGTELVQSRLCAVSRTQR